MQVFKFSETKWNIILKVLLIQKMKFAYGSDYIHK